MIKMIPETINIKKVTATIFLIWLAVIWFSLTVNLVNNSNQIKELARTSARSSIEKDILYRRWNAMNGGVYGLIQGETVPNPYLDVPERDITTPGGQRLTKINPAYMTRQVHELARKSSGEQGHITSLKPLRPQNAPDPWEEEALKTFEAGPDEVSSIEEISGKKYLRFMKVLRTEQACLQCHAQQGYRVGDIRGGISISVPLAPWFAVGKAQTYNILFGHIAIGLIGLLGILGGSHKIQKKESERVAAEEALIISEAKLQAVISNAAVGIALFDKRGKFMQANQAWSGMTGYTEEEMSKLTQIEITHLSDKDINKESLEKSKSGYQKLSEKLASKNKQLQVNNKLIHDQKEKLEQLNKDLDFSNHAKDQFFSILSHDLRGPLGSFSELSAVLLENIDKFDHKKIKLFMAEIHKSAENIYNLLENLLDWSWFQLGQMEFKLETFKMAEIVEETFELLGNQARQKEISLVKDQASLGAVKTDRNTVKTLLRNLVTNAIKFTPRNGQIKVFGQPAKNNDFIEFYVQDTGIGIAPENINKLFDLSVSFKNPGTENEKGSGLGLILCKELIEKCGGKIRVESEPGQGSTFSFTLPQE